MLPADIRIVKRRLLLNLRARFFLPASIALLVILISETNLRGQYVGHYIGGATGLENGTTAPPGLFITYIPVVENVNSIKGPNGNTVIRPKINVVANLAAYTFMAPRKILGGDYGLSVLFTVVNTRFTANVFNITELYGGVSDLYFAPLILGWEKGKANYTVNYGFYAPTGDFNPNSSMNPGLGYWEQQIQAGATYNLDKKKLWNTSALTTWEINSSVSGLAVTPGPMFTGEYSFGRRFDKYQMNAGVVGYGYTKLAADSGNGINPLFRGLRDRAFATGGEWKYTNIKWHLVFDFRYEREYGVELRTSGGIFVGGITFLDLLPPKPTK
jgi:hypothetical protein